MPATAGPCCYCFLHSAAFVPLWNLARLSSLTFPRMPCPAQQVPPLRARPADIKALASHYLQQHATRTGAKRLDLEAPALRWACCCAEQLAGWPTAGLDKASPYSLFNSFAIPDCRRRLLSWSFPYNLEELRTACERVAIEAQATRLADAALIGQPAASPASAALAAPASSCACKSGGKACGGSNACGGTGACCGGSRGATSSSDDAAVVAAPAVLGEAAPQPLSSEALWFLAADQDRGRVNLLDQWPMLRAVLRRGLWTTWLNRYVTPMGFPLLLAALFLGPQARRGRGRGSSGRGWETALGEPLPCRMPHSMPASLLTVLPRPPACVRRTVSTIWACERWGCGTGCCARRAAVWLSGRVSAATYPAPPAPCCPRLCVWAIWWPSMFLSYPLFGRWWCSGEVGSGRGSLLELCMPCRERRCSPLPARPLPPVRPAVCPFMLAGEAVQSARKAVPGLPPLLKWPKEAERIGPWALVAMFAGQVGSLGRPALLLSATTPAASSLSPIRQL